MLNIVNASAERKTPDIVLVTWAISPYAYGTPYTIYRSITGQREYELIGAGIGNAYIDDIRECRDNEYIEYKIESMGDTDTVQLYRQADNWLLAVAGDYLWQLEHAYASTKAVAYCLGKSNNNCPECFSETLNKQTKTICDTCDGSGKMTSYVGPIPFRFSPRQTSRGMENMGVGEKDSEIIAAWTGNIPLFNKGDIIITNMHDKYMVQAFPVMTSMHSTVADKIFIAKQDLILKKLKENEYPKLLYYAKEA